VLAVRKAEVENPLRVMLAAHMDEVGFMIVEDNDNGLYEFQTVGGIDVRQLAGKAVQVGPDHIPGVIGTRPIHLLESGEFERAIPLSSLRIDIGPGGGKVKIGDRATFATRFMQVGPSLRGKALDDRLGVATVIELLKHAPRNVEILAAFTTQEEIGGLRGARVAGYAFDPDLAFVLDCTPANDLPTWDNSENAVYNTRQGLGPAIYIADNVTLSDPRLIRHLIQVGDRHQIPYQFRQPGGGGTDAGTIHKVRSGVPTISISVPGRYLHTAISLIRAEDWQNDLRLVYAALHDLPRDVLSIERR
jgi:tetrahedral aminopeptidase